MTKMGTSTSKGFHVLEGVQVVQKTVSGLVRLQPTVITDVFPHGKTLADLIAISFNGVGNELFATNTSSGDTKYFSCGGMVGSENYMTFECVNVAVEMSGNALSFTVRSGYQHHSDGTSNTVVNAQFYTDSIFEGEERVVTFFFK